MGLYFYSMCVEEVEIAKFHEGSKEYLRDPVITEIPFTIYINNKEFVTLTTIPKDLKELTLGFLKTEGIIDTPSDIELFSLNAKEFTVRVSIPGLFERRSETKRIIGSGCGTSISFYYEKDLNRFSSFPFDFSISSYKVIELMTEFQKKSKFFNLTGGTHAAAISNLEDILFFSEDIGRHNAVDKVIGMTMSKDINSSSKILLTTGRVSGEILRKLIYAKIPIIISRSAPTLLAIRQAQKLNITLIGFARGRRFNVYSGLERIK